MENKLKLSKKIKLVASDFDGVFTDGSVYIDENFNYQKKISFKDIMAVSMLIKAGYKFAIISGEKSNILNYFKEKFGIEDIYGGIRHKGEVLKKLMEEMNLTSQEVLYIGDDINDIEAFELVEYRIAPKNANPYLRTVKKLQKTEAQGGDGAVREVVDCLLNNTVPPSDEENKTIKL